MNEHTAIQRMKRGDIGGLAVLVSLYEVQAIRTAYLITHDRALAEDVVQNTFLRIYQHIGQYDARRPFAPWFMRSVVNAAIRAARQHQRDVSLDTPFSNEFSFADLLPDPAPGPDDQIEMGELKGAVWEALGKLSPEQRAAVVMRYFLDLSDSDMSAELDCSPSTVRWRLHMARKQLRTLLHRFSRDRSSRGWQEGV